MSKLIPHSAAMPTVYLATTLDNGQIEFHAPGVIGWQYEDNNYHPRLVKNVNTEGEVVVLEAHSVKPLDALSFLVTSFKRKDGSSTEPKFVKSLADAATFIMVDGRKE